MKHKLDYKKVFKWQLKWKVKYFPKMKFKRLRSLIDTIKLWVRWHFKYKKWFPVIERNHKDLIIYKLDPEDTEEFTRKDWDSMKEKRHVIK